MLSIPSTAVVMPVRNGMPLIEESLASIRYQNLSVELAIVDDASTDGTLEYLRGLNGFCSQVLESGGRGPSAARNMGIRATNSEYIAFLDADDIWPLGSLYALSKALAENPDADFAQGLVRNFRARPDGSRDFFTPPYRFLNLGACLWRRSLFEKVGLLDEELNLSEDLDFLMRCWEKDIFKADLDVVTLFYRRHPGNMTRGLSGAAFGTVKAYKRRIERIRKGEYDPTVTRRCEPNDYLGTGPADQDGHL
jgi:glycosyltransferase involved in cell wall biosynthesis